MTGAHAWIFPLTSRGRCNSRRPSNRAGFIMPFGRVSSVSEICRCCARRRPRSCVAPGIASKSDSKTAEGLGRNWQSAPMEPSRGCGVAHVLHPLAGQGVNLGLGDAHSLADLLRAAPDPGDRLLLRRYERARAEDILALRWVTDGLFRLFDANHRMAARIRNFGLNLTNSNPVVKTLLARRAMGIGGGRHHRESS